METNAKKACLIKNRVQTIAVTLNYGYIYLTTNKISGTLYVGQHHGAFTHKYLGNGVKLLMAVKSYGSHAFSVEMVEEAKDQDDLNKKEIKAIMDLRHKGHNLYNILPGGKGHPVGWKMSKEACEKLSKSKLGKPIPHAKKMVNALRSKMLGVPFDPEHKEKLRKAKLGKKLSASHRKAMSDGWAKWRINKKLSGSVPATVLDRQSSRVVNNK